MGSLQISAIFERFIFVPMKKQFLFIIVLILHGCSENAGVRQYQTKEATPTFEVSLEAVVSQDDDFALYYTTNGTIDFTQKPPIWVKVKGQGKAQQIGFKLPEGVFPTQLRLDLGRNPAQDAIDVVAVRMQYQHKRVDLPEAYVFSYFRADVNSTHANSSTGKISGRVENGKRRTPSLYPKEGPLSEQLEYLAE